MPEWTLELTLKLQETYLHTNPVEVHPVNTSCSPSHVWVHSYNVSGKEDVKLIV